jgi:hypothetical protein
MKKLLCAFMALTAWVAQTWAADGITIADANIPQGGETVVEVLLTSAEKSYGGFQFEVALPAGVSLVKVDKADRLTAIENYVLNKSLTDADNNVYTVLGYNIDRQSIAGTSGAIAYLTLQASGEMTVGDVFDATVQNVVLSTVDEENVDAANSSFTVTIGEPADPRVVLDENSTTAPLASNGAVDVRVKRTINAGEWSTICLPFNMMEEQVKAAFGSDVQIGDFTGCTVVDDNVSVNFSNVTAMEANHPYIIKVSSAVSEFTVDGVDIAADNAEVKVNKSGRKYNRFIGNYENGTELEDGFLFLNANKFYFSNGSTKIKAFRGYFNLETADAYYEESRRIVLNFGDATGIETIVKDEADKVFNLSGQQVKAPAKGVFVKNGKKIIVK